MIEGYTPVPVEHFGGLITAWPPEMLDVSLAVEATNVRFRESGVETRQGLSMAFKAPSGQTARTVIGYVQLSGAELPVLIDASGNLYVERVAGSGALQLVSPMPPLTATANAVPVATTAFNRVYLAFGDGKQGIGPPASFDGTNFDPVTISAPGTGLALADSATAGNVVGGQRYGIVMFRTREGSLSPASAPVPFSAAGALPAPPGPSVGLIQTGSSTLASGTYYFVYTWTNSTGESLASAETAIVVPTSNTYAISVARGVPPNGATGWKVYGGTASGAETLQTTTNLGPSGIAYNAPLATGGAAPPGSNTSGRQLSVSGIPTGPASVAARVVAFTVAGGVAAGPFFYIEEAQTVNGVNETATVINDNVTTAGTFNFDDSFLASSLDSTDQFTAIVLPNMAGVTYSRTTDRMLWWGDPAQPSVVYCSQPSDAGVYLGDTGIVSVGENDGTRIMSVFEFRDQIYVTKEAGIYLVTPSGSAPASWSVARISEGAGAASARASVVGTGYFLTFHRTGMYQSTGGAPELVSDEQFGAAQDQPGTWDRINWAYERLIWMDDDREEKCVRIGVPLDGATQCSHILKVSYLEGWEKSIRFSPFTARYHYFPGRRWSVDTIAANGCTRVQRPLALGGIPADRRAGQSQVLLASADPGGLVHYLDPSAATDDGIAFGWAMRTGAASASEVVRQNRQGMEMIGVVQARARGTGTVLVEACADRADPRKIGEIELDGTDAGGDWSGLALAQGEAIGLRLSGGFGGAPCSIRMSAMYVFARPTWALRPFGQGGQ